MLSLASFGSRLILLYPVQCLYACVSVESNSGRLLWERAQRWQATVLLWVRDTGEWKWANPASEHTCWCVMGLNPVA